jgi:hypothetical protein
MQPRFLIAVLGMAWLALWISPASGEGGGHFTAMREKMHDGGTRELKIDSARVLATSPWIIGKNSPQLQIDQAARIAEDWRLAHSDRLGRFAVKEVTVRRLPCDGGSSDHWYYFVEYRPAVTTPLNFDNEWIGILFDGTVVEPTVQP